MERNLDRRIEVLFPVTDPELQARVLEVLDLNLADDTNSWVLGPNGTWDAGPDRRGRSAPSTGCRSWPATGPGAGASPRPSAAGRASRRRLGEPVAPGSGRRSASGVVGPAGPGLVGRGSSSGRVGARADRCAGAWARAVVDGTTRRSRRGHRAGAGASPRLENRSDR